MQRCPACLLVPSVENADVGWFLLPDAECVRRSHPMVLASRTIPIARPLLLALIVAAVALFVLALVVAAAIGGPHLAQSLAHSLLANGGGPRWPCPGGTPVC